MDSFNRSTRTFSRRNLRIHLLILAISISGLALGGATVAQEAPSIAIETISVEPASPGPDTLCKLTVKLANNGERTASQLDFKRHDQRSGAARLRQPALHVSRTGRRDGRYPALQLLEH